MKILTGYYQKKKKNRKKENLRKEVGERYQNLSEEQKIKKWKNACERYQSFSEEKENKCQYYREHNKNLSEDWKQRLVEYRRNYYITHKK